jgi:Gluconate 2-dehydrogenase subunit 3
LEDTRYGFFADPIYGGNRDMAAWKMIGFPGARYDYRDWVERHNERYPHPPISIAGFRAPSQQQPWRRPRSERMATKLPATRHRHRRLGWTGSIIAESMTKAGYNVVAIEHGPWRDTATDFPPSYAPDELRYAVRLDLFVRTAQTTLTFRNNPSQTALPVREWGAFLLPNGVGGAGVHWNAEIWRFLPTDFVLKTHLTQRYGAKFLPEDMTIQDYSVTYDELEPYYDAFEYLCGLREPRETSRGRSSHSVIRGRDRGRVPIRRRRRSSPMDRCYGQRRRKRWATAGSRSPPAISRRPIPNRSA